MHNIELTPTADNSTITVKLLGCMRETANSGRELVSVSQPESIDRDAGNRK